MEKFFKRPWIIVAVISAITVFFAIQLPRAQLDNNNFRFVPEQDPARLTSHYIDETFGSQVVIMIGLERKYGTVLDRDFLLKMKSYTDKVKEMPIVDSVMSLSSMDYITADGDSIVAKPLVPEGFTGTPAEITALRTRVRSWDMYRRSLVSDDLSSTQIVVAFDIPPENAGDPKTIQSLNEVKKLAKETFSSDANVYVTGLPVFSADVNVAVNADLFFLIPLVILVVLFVLFFSFKRLSGVVLPLITVLVATIWSVGAMPLLGIKLSVLTTVLPVILVAVGSAYGIHVVTHYLEERDLSGTLDEAAHRKLVFDMLRKINKPVFLAALTTFAGFVSFCFTNVLPIREFGYFSSFGVVVSYIVSVSLIPALFLIRGPKPLPDIRGGKKREKEIAEFTDPLSTALADAFSAIARKRRATLVGAGLCVAVSLIGVTKIVIDNVLVEYFKDDTDIVRSDGFIRKYFGGSKIVSVVVSTDTPGEVLRPDVLVAMDGLSVYLTKNVPEVGKVTSFTDLVKRINQVYNADESPDGITAVVAAQSAASSASDDSSFGFGSFEEETSAPAPTAAPAKKREAKTITTDELGALLAAAESSGGSADMSAGDLALALRKAVNYEGSSYYEVPSDPARYGKTTPEELKQLVSNYLVLLSGDIKAFADDPLEPKSIRMNVQLRTVGQIDTDRAIDEINRYVAAKFPTDVKVTIGGTALVEKSLNELVVQSQISSVFVSLLMVFLIIAFSYRSAIAGLFGIAPLSISVLLNFAIMGFTGIKLNIGTALVASVSVGIGIDYTIHYLEAYRREYLASGGKGNFLRRTFATSGKAIMINAISVGAGFAVLMLSKFNILANLGLLIAFTMFSSSIVALTVLPAMLTVFNPKFITKEKL
jgi:predicted RND superfamily exporter protein